MKNSVIKKVIDIAGSQAKLAQVLGCAQSLISAWLYGKNGFRYHGSPILWFFQTGRFRLMNCVLICLPFSRHLKPKPLNKFPITTGGG